MVYIMAIQQTLGRLRSKFFWPNLKASVESFVKQCRICSLVKPKFVCPRSMPILSKAPMEILACDFVGPLPVSQGCRYLLVIIDMYSRFPFVFPLNDMTGKSAINCFRTVFSFSGFPNFILSDCGSQFESEEFKSFLRKFSIQKLRTNAYHPAGNGLCERFNRTFKQLMLSYITSKSVSNNQLKDSLPHCLLDYRTTHHSATGCRPVDLFYSFNVKGHLPAGRSDTNKAFRNDLKSKSKRKYYLIKVQLIEN